MALLLVVPGAFAVTGTTTQTSVSPSAVPADGIVTISTCTTSIDVLQLILVTTADGVVWKSTTAAHDVRLSPNYLCPTTFDLAFGNGSPGWCVISLVPVVLPANPNQHLPLWPCLAPQSQTGTPGSYSVTWIWVSHPGGTEQFNVSKNFQIVGTNSVPEFGLPAVMLTALGFAVLAKYRMRRET